MIYWNYMNKKGEKFVNLIKKYGPGFVAVSKTSGRVMAHGRDIEKMYLNADKKGIDYSKVVISHVPKYGSLSLYWRG